MKVASSIWLALALIFTAAPSADPAYAQDAAAQYPNRTIRIIAPFAAGALTDTLARFIAQHLQQAWGQPVVVENRAGASGAIGTAYAAQAPADGYTLVVVTSGHVINPNFGKVPFDPIKDFDPIIFLTGIPSLLVVHPDVPVKTIGEFVKMIKDNPGQYTYATSGAGGSSHITTEAWKYVAGLDMQHVPYKGGAPAITDLIGGHIKIAMSTVSTAIKYVQGGQARAIAVTSPKRSPVLPDVPTLAESGYPEIALVEWFGMIAPAGVPLAIRQKLNTEIIRIMNLPEVKDKLAAQGVAFEGGTIDEFDQFIKSDYAKWAKLIKDAGIKNE
jgi:tripartite-type tricarboxylate transporter receptor subunit TctC